MRMQTANFTSHRLLPRAFMSSVLLTLVVTVVPGQAAKPPAPVNRTYFIVAMGLAETGPYAIEADCMAITDTEMCTSDTCLTWHRDLEGTQTKKQSAFNFSTQIEDDGFIITLDGHGRVDNRGRKSALSGSGTARAGGIKMNFSFLGREATPSRCTGLLESFVENRP